MVLYQNNFFSSQLSMLLLARSSVSLQLSAVKGITSTAAGWEGWGGLESIPTPSHALPEETSSRFIFCS